MFFINIFYNNVAFYLKSGVLTACNKFTPSPNRSGSSWLATAGYLTSGNTCVYFTIPLDNAGNLSSSISNMSLQIRQNGNYLFGSADARANFTGTIYIGTNLCWLYVGLTFPNSIGGTNNSTVGIDAEFTLTVS